MSDKRFSGDYDRTSFSYLLASIIGERKGDFSPTAMAETLDRHANRIRNEADETVEQWTIQPRDTVGPNIAVYDETGEEYLFTDKDQAFEVVRDELNDEE